MDFIRKSLFLFLFLLPNVLLAQEVAFPLPEIPSELKSPQERADYLALHYWERFDFGNSELVDNKFVTEQGFVDFISIMPYVAEKRAAFCTLAGGLAGNVDMLRYFMLLAGRYLAEPESPLCNEELYIFFLESIVEEKDTPEAFYEEAAFELLMAKKNRVGERANDFRFITRSGQRVSLSKVKGEYTLLFFADPECFLCRITKEEVLASETITKMVGEGRLNVLYVCLAGKSEAWKKTPAPQAWIDACDEKQTVYEKLLYDVPGLPVLYLLDADKVVLLKNATVSQVVSFLKALP